MRQRLAVVLATAMMAAAAPAWAASDKQDFELCDGRKQPGHQADGLRDAPSISPDSPVSGSDARRLTACTAALASPRLLPTQVLRRIHLLRARAAARLRLGDAPAALVDLDTAEQAGTTLAGDRFYRRSMGVSLQLLRALALRETGDAAGAGRLAAEAAAARPYSLAVQQAAAQIRQAGDAAGWLAAGRLQPEFGAMALFRAAKAGAFADVIAAGAYTSIEWPPHATGRDAAPAAQMIQLLVKPLILSLDLAQARAATGDPAGARALLAETRRQVETWRPDPAAKDAAMATAAFQPLARLLEVRGRAVEARVALAEGRRDEALAIAAGPMPDDAGTRELIAALHGDTNAAAMPPPAEREPPEDDLVTVVNAALLEPETPRAVIDYERSRPNILGALVAGAASMGTSLLSGIGKTDGFRSTSNADGTIKVEFTGNTVAKALVEEMTLLRAAELARAAGKPAFVVVRRDDYERRWVTTQYGYETSNTGAGFKTELTIRPVDIGTASGRALDAIAVIDALGPYHYEAPKA